MRNELHGIDWTEHKPADPRLFEVVRDMMQGTLGPEANWIVLVRRHGHADVYVSNTRADDAVTWLERTMQRLREWSRRNPVKP